MAASHGFFLGTRKFYHSHGFFLGTRKFYHTTLFVPHITDRLQSEALLQCYYLPESFTTLYTNAGKFKFISTKNHIISFVIGQEKQIWGFNFWAT
jgi:hypothetical protein